MPFCAGAPLPPSVSNTRGVEPDRVIVIALPVVPGLDWGMFRLLLIIVLLAVLRPVVASAAGDLDGSFGPASAIEENGLLAESGIFAGGIRIAVDEDTIEAALPLVEVGRSGEVLTLTGRGMSLELRQADQPGVYASRSMTDPRNGDGLVWGRREGDGVVLYRFWLFSDGAYALFGFQLTPDDDGLAARAWFEVDGDVVGTASARLAGGS